MAIFEVLLSSDGEWKTPSSGMEISFLKIAELGPAYACVVGLPEADPFRREASLRAICETDFSVASVLLAGIEETVEELGVRGDDDAPPLKENPIWGHHEVRRRIRRSIVA